MTPLVTRTNITPPVLSLKRYLAAFTTFLSLASAGGGIIIMYYQARSLQRKQRNRIAANAVSA